MAFPAQRVVITAGGTGGHLYPAQALAEQLELDSPQTKVLFVGGGLSVNRFFNSAKFTFKEIHTLPLLSRKLSHVFKGITGLFRGFSQSVHILKTYQPHVVVGFGSYYTVPLLLAARWLRIPIVLHEANSVPGKANRWLARLSTCVGVHFPFTAAKIKGKTFEVDLPLRSGYTRESITREEALEYFGFISTKKTLLIVGGSQGARKINEFIEQCMAVFQELSLQVIHLTGDAYTSPILIQQYANHYVKACVKPFEEQMQKAWRAADFFIGRAGASTIAESIAFEVPGILIPYPHATDQHQEKNADYVVNQIGAGWKFNEKELSAQTLKAAIFRFYKEKKYESFHQALQQHKQRPNQMTLCQLVRNIEVIQGKR
jgi:UDP-N-acetylglucosamine--N-acetylmuramyl-(pentapeptide) pyrophosphoryl-undecaprenol N-acetylglucosamine transferase